MKTIRNLTTTFGLSLVLVALGTIGARGQVLNSTQFVGTFTLPIPAKWGTTTLPAGNYTLHYGTINAAGGFVEVRGLAKGSPQSVIRVDGISPSSATKNALVCIRDRDTLIVGNFEMPAIGKSADFALPPGAKLLARSGKRGGNTQLAHARMLFQQIPVASNAK